MIKKALQKQARKLVLGVVISIFSITLHHRLRGRCAKEKEKGVVGRKRKTW